MQFGRGGVLLASSVDAGKHPDMHRTAATHRTTWPQMLKNPGLLKKTKQLIKKIEQAECINQGALSRGLQMLTCYSSRVS